MLKRIMTGFLLLVTLVSLAGWVRSEWALDSFHMEFRTHLPDKDRWVHWSIESCNGCIGITRNWHEGFSPGGFDSWMKTEPPVYPFWPGTVMASPLSEKLGLIWYNRKYSYTPLNITIAIFPYWLLTFGAALWPIWHLRNYVAMYRRKRSRGFPVLREDE
jgi:hypothetical protein